MVLTAGIISLISAGSNSAQLATTSASGGTAPYTQQWYRDTSGSGFTPGSGNILTGQTGLTLNDINLIPNTTYFYKVVYTDSVPNTVNSTAFTVTTLPASQSLNQFAMAAILGAMDLQIGPQNVVAAQIDVSQSTLLYPGQPIKFANNPYGIPTVVSSGTDMPNGYILYDQKSQNFAAGARCEIARTLSCIWLYATAPITRGAMVTIDPTIASGVKQITGSSALPIIGEAFDEATAGGQLIRIILNTPSNMYDDTTSSGTNYFPTQQIFTSGAGTYVPPVTPRLPLYLIVELCGGGGGGSGSSQGEDAGNGTDGGDTTFSGTGATLTAHGGKGGAFAAPGAGGTCVASTSYPGKAFTGEAGSASMGVQFDLTNHYPAQLTCLGGDGGASLVNGAGKNGTLVNAVASSGCGGGGPSISAVSATAVLWNAGQGGGGGGYMRFIVPAQSYSWTCGAHGNGGIAGTLGAAGGNGGGGLIIVTECYQ